MGVEGLSQGFRAWGKGPHRTRLKTIINDLSLFVLLGLFIGWEGAFFKVKSVYTLLCVHIVLSSLILLYQCRLLQKRFIADALSFLNFALLY